MSAGDDLERTVELLARVRQGDDAARERLIARYLPILKRWAHGRLPARSRSMADTDDLVQVTLVRAVRRLGDFEPRREGAFLAYLRRIVLSAVRDETVRKANIAELPAEHEPVDPRPIDREEDIGSAEMLEAFDAALTRLPPVQQEAVILRIEFGFSYPEIAEAIGSPSSDAARMTVTRAIARLATELGPFRSR